MIKRFVRDTRGATAIEYGLIAVVIIGALAALPTKKATPIPEAVPVMEPMVTPAPEETRSSRVP